MLIKFKIIYMFIKKTINEKKKKKCLHLSHKTPPLHAGLSSKQEKF